MADGKELDKIFAAHAVRKSTEAEAAEAAKDKRRAFGEEAHQLFNTVVLPALNELATELSERGMETSVSEPDTKGAPIRSHLSLKVAGTHNLVSKITFSTGGLNEDRGLETRWEVNGSDRSGSREAQDTAGDQRVRFEDVNVEWVRSSAVAFVEAVLRAD